jgi:hypothetical protein
MQRLPNSSRQMTRVLPADSAQSPAVWQHEWQRRPRRLFLIRVELGLSSKSGVVVTGWRVRRLKPRGAPELVYATCTRPAGTAWRRALAGPTCRALVTRTRVRAHRADQKVVKVRWRCDAGVRVDGVHAFSRLNQSVAGRISGARTKADRARRAEHHHRQRHTEVIRPLRRSLLSPLRRGMRRTAVRSSSTPRARSVTRARSA